MRVGNIVPFLFLYLPVLLSCSQPSGRHRVTIEDSIAVSPLKKEDATAASSLPDTLVITGKVAVMYSPDSARIATQKMIAGEDDFYTAADDNIYYCSNSADYFKEEGLPVVRAKSSQCLQFVFSDKTSQYIRLDTVVSLWGVYLFDAIKEPYSADITNIQQEYKHYCQQ